MKKIMRFFTARGLVFTGWMAVTSANICVLLDRPVATWSVTALFFVLMTLSMLSKRAEGWGRGRVLFNWSVLAACGLTLPLSDLVPMWVVLVLFAYMVLGALAIVVFEIYKYLVYVYEEIRRGVW